MIKVQNVEVTGWDAAVRGMRSPMNSWANSDSKWVPMIHPPADPNDYIYLLGDNDLALATKLVKAGPEHRKFLRMLHVSMDITAPLFWWSEFDTYKVGTSRNSCSKMHKIHAKSFEESDFSCESCAKIPYAKDAFDGVIAACEKLRLDFNETGNRDFWRALIELLPESFNLRATWDGSMETLLAVMKQRNGHKLKEEWGPFRDNCFNQIPYLADFYNAAYWGGVSNGQDGQTRGDLLKA